MREQPHFSVCFYLALWKSFGYESLVFITVRFSHPLKLVFVQHLRRDEGHGQGFNHPCKSHFTAYFSMAFRCISSKYLFEMAGKGDGTRKRNRPRFPHQLKVCGKFVLLLTVTLQKWSERGVVQKMYFSLFLLLLRILRFQLNVSFNFSIQIFF